ncbi:unnamed protein product [Schistocephalus solidus]|uniref:Uncharacterized protein n=1 Tax=Schistocephalus solidus TaxID=70667 RepID=A0A183STM4_SCHSO|nr:unnamed protein product [Schistocephalus solidus]
MPLREAPPQAFRGRSGWNRNMQRLASRGPPCYCCTKNPTDYYNLTEYHVRQHPKDPQTDCFQAAHELMQEHPPEYVPSVLLAQRNVRKPFCSSCNPNSISTFSGSIGEAAVTQFFPSTMDRLLQQGPRQPVDPPLHPETEFLSRSSSFSGPSACATRPEPATAVDILEKALKETIRSIIIFSLLLNLLPNGENNAPPPTNLDPEIDDGVRVVIRPFNLSDYPLRRIPSFRWGSEYASTT